MADLALVGAPPPALRHDRMEQAWIATSVLSWLGTAAWTAALAWQAVHSLSPAWAGAVVGISTIPQALLSLPGGVIADRHSTRTIMMLGQLCDAGVLLTGAALWGRIPALPLRIAASPWPAGIFGMTEAVFSATAIAGSLLAAWISPRRPIAASYWLLIVQGAFYAGVAVPSIAVLTVSMSVMGLTSGCASVWLSAQFVQVIDPPCLGRVAALSKIGDLLLVPLTSPAFGALTATVGIGISPIIPAAAMIAMCALILLGHSALRAEHNHVL